MLYRLYKNSVKGFSYDIQKKALAALFCNRTYTKENLFQDFFKHPFVKKSNFDYYFDHHTFFTKVRSFLGQDAANMLQNKTVSQFLCDPDHVQEFFKIAYQKEYIDEETFECIQKFLIIFKKKISLIDDSVKSFFQKKDNKLYCNRLKQLCVYLDLKKLLSLMPPGLLYIVEFPKKFTNNSSASLNWFNCSMSQSSKPQFYFFDPFSSFDWFSFDFSSFNSKQSEYKPKKSNKISNKAGNIFELNDSDALYQNCNNRNQTVFVKVLFHNEHLKTKDYEIFKEKFKDKEFYFGDGAGSIKKTYLEYHADKLKLQGVSDDLAKSINHLFGKIIFLVKLMRIQKKEKAEVNIVFGTHEELTFQANYKILD